jgi:hypothetical protein
MEKSRKTYSQVILWHILKGTFEGRGPSPGTKNRNNIAIQLRFHSFQSFISCSYIVRAA